MTSATGTGAMTYNTHGDALTIGTQSFTYDSSDRVVSGTAGGANQAVAYTLDAIGRTVTRVGSGTAPGVDASTTTYSYTGDGDTPDLQLTSTGTIGERYLSLPGGVLYTKRYAATGGDIWAFPNIHGDTLTTTGTTGTILATPAIYDPYGNPLAQTTGVVDLTTDPTTRTGGLTDGWEGAHQRGAEHTGTANWILMGARIYLPGYGQFATTDPIFAGNTNPYTYPDDPINFSDLNGQWGIDWRSVGKWAAIGAGVIGAVACGMSVICGIAVGAAAGAAAYASERAGTSAFSWTGLGVATGIGATGGLLRFGGGAAIGRAAFGSRTLGVASNLFGRARVSGVTGALNRGALRLGWGWKGAAQGGSHVFRASWSKAGSRSAWNHVDFFWRRG